MTPKPDRVSKAIREYRDAHGLDAQDTLSAEAKADIAAQIRTAAPIDTASVGPLPHGVSLRPSDMVDDHTTPLSPDAVRHYRGGLALVARVARGEGTDADKAAAEAWIETGLMPGSAQPAIPATPVAAPAAPRPQHETATPAARSAKPRPPAPAPVTPARQDTPIPAPILAPQPDEGKVLTELNRLRAQREARRRFDREEQRQDATDAIPLSEIEDAVDVARQGRKIAEDGIPYLFDGLIPNYGMFGFNIAYAKVGKTTFGLALAAHVATGRPFLGRATQRTRVLIIAAEDPPEYTAWLARHHDVEPGWLKFWRHSVALNPDTLARICATIKRDKIGFLLIASWQAVVRSLVKDENDNAGAVRVVEDVKELGARVSGIPWLIDAHSGKGEDQKDEADPMQAMRGASAAVGAVDFVLSLRYANGAFGTTRRLSARGRFVLCPPLLMDFNAATSAYTVIGSVKDQTRDETWRLICETGALTDTPRTVVEIARESGHVNKDGKVDGARRRLVLDALKDRPGVSTVEETRRGQKTTLYRRLESPA